MLQRWIAHGVASDLPTIHVVSDSTGTTAKAVARAALASFGETNPAIEILPGIKSAAELTEELDAHLARHRTRQIPGAFIIFYTLVDDELRAAMEAFVTSARECESDPARKIIAVDVLAQAHDALAEATGRTPEPHPGALYSIDDQYFSRLARWISRSTMMMVATRKTSRKRISFSLAYRALRRRRFRSIFRSLAIRSPMCRSIVRPNHQRNSLRSILRASSVL